MEDCSNKILNTLIQHLKTNDFLEQTVLTFKFATKNNSEKIQFAEKLLKEFELLPNYDEFKLTKCNKKAEIFKNLGNQLYKNEKFFEALVSYNKSLCYSPEDSQNVGIGFANRSAVYLALGQYEKCLENIELAKNHNYPKDKMDKLNKREEQALEILNNDPDPNQKLMKYKAARGKFLKPKLKAKENLNFFVADCLEVKTSPEFGRHLITNKDLKVGSVIAVEKPFSKIVVPEAIHERCANCLGRNLLNLLPCFNCCSAMFCSEDCRNTAQEKFHKFECGLVNLIDKVSSSFGLPLRTYFEALNICKTPSKLREFLESIKDSDATILDFNYTAEASFQKDFLHSTYALTTIEKSEYFDDFDPFACSNFCAILCNLMLNHSEALKAVLVDDADQDFFREFIFKFTRIAAVNCHRLHCMSPTANNDEIQFGSGFFPLNSLMNHSCAPNISRESIGTSTCIVTIRPIKKGGQIYDDYGFHHYMKPLKERQKDLFKLYRFKCNCEACQKDYPMRNDLNVKNKNQQETLMKERYSLEVMRNFDVAVDNYGKYCKLIEKLDKDYPSYEVVTLQDLMLLCFRTFLKDESYEI